MRHGITVIISLCLLSVSGCRLLHSGVDFPDGIKAECHGARNAAKAAIQSKGFRLKSNGGCEVIKRLGTRKIKGMWAWQDPRWPGMYVLGLCTGPKIWIGCNPTTKREVSTTILTHEFVHHWLVTNYNDYTHRAELDSVVDGWRRSRQLTGRAVTLSGIRSTMQTLKEGDIVSVDFMEQSGKVHVDFVVVNPQ